MGSGNDIAPSPVKAKQPSARASKPARTDVKKKPVQPAGNQAAQRALSPGAARDPGNAQPAPDKTQVENLWRQEKLELYQGIEFQKLAGVLNYQRDVTIITPHKNRATLTVKGRAQFLPGGPRLPLPFPGGPPLPGPRYPPGYSLVVPGKPEQMELKSDSSYDWEVYIEYADPKIRKWLPKYWRPVGSEGRLQGKESLSATAAPARLFALLRLDAWAQYKSLSDFVDRSEDEAREVARQREEAAKKKWRRPADPAPPPGPDDPDAEVVPAPEELDDDDDDEPNWFIKALAAIIGAIIDFWNWLPWEVRVFLKWAAVTVATIAAAVVVVYFAAEIIVGVAAVFGVALEAAAVAEAIGAIIVLYVLIKSGIKVAMQGANPLAVPGLAILDALGIKDMIETFTDEDMITRTPYHRTKEQRLEAFLNGATQFFTMLLGLKGLLSRRGIPAIDPDAPPAVPPVRPPTARPDITPPDVAPPDVPGGAHPAPDTPGTPPSGPDTPGTAPPGPDTPGTAPPGPDPNVRPNAPPPAVDASAFATPETYLDAIRRSPKDTTVAGHAWDYTRFPRGPRRRWRAGDPVDMPASDGTYPTFDTARGRFWRNRAVVELERRAKGIRTRQPNSPDPILSMSDQDLTRLRDTATADVRSPGGWEIEHFGVPQRAGGWLENAGFNSSDARRLSNVANPNFLLEVSPPEHAFFDAEAHSFGRLRADADGRMWTGTPTADPRVARPLYFMSDADITEIVTRARNDPGINLSRSPDLLRALRTEIAERGLSIQAP